MIPIRTDDYYRDAITRVEELEKALALAVQNLNQIKELSNINKPTKEMLIHLGNHLNDVLKWNPNMR